jgi:hypothetical protein
MGMDDHMSQDLWQYDVDICRKGFLTVFARSHREAEAQVSDMTEDEILKQATWTDVEAEVS